MSESNNVPIKVDIQFYDESDVLQFRTWSFTGEDLDYYEDAHAAFTLYRWLDKGYVVYVENFKTDSKIVYPIDRSGKGYTAEEVAKQWPASPTCWGSRRIMTWILMSHPRNPAPRISWPA